MRLLTKGYIHIRSSHGYKQECIPVGCVPSAAVAVSGVCVPRGCLPVGGGLPGGVSDIGGGVHLPPVDRMTDTCENITFPQLLLRTVKICSCYTLTFKYFVTLGPY